MSLKLTTAINKIGTLSARIWGLQGGQGAAKTFSVLAFIIDFAFQVPDQNILVVSDEFAKMKLTVIRDFKIIMKALGVFNSDNFPAQKVYRFPNGSTITFLGLDKDDIGKGLRSNLAFFNEANKCSFEAYQQIASRAERVICDFNPDAHFWFHEEVEHRDDCETLILTFLDNEELSITEQNEILRYKELGFNSDGSVKSEYWANKWRVYGLGLKGKLDGLIFEYKIIAEVPDTAERLATGLDFGYTNDPTAATDVYKYGKDAIVLNQLLYKTRLTNPAIAEELLEYDHINSKSDIVADSAEPKSIDELIGCGLNVWRASKGRDSIKNGIDILQRFTIYITEDSVDVINEFNNYTWKIDKKTGLPMGVPIDKYNHAIDGIRYVALLYLAEGKGKLKVY